MRHLPFITLFLLFLLLAAGPLVLAGSPVDLPGFAPAEPELHLSADGSSLLFVHRAAATGEPDRAAAALLLAEARNPGLLRAFAAHVFARWLDDGLVGLDAGGHLAFDPADKPALEARLRLAVALHLAPYLREIASAADPDVLAELASEPGTPVPAHVAGLPPLAAPWYHPAGDEAHPQVFNKETVCGPCDEGEQPGASVFCPGQCVKDCDGPGSNCIDIDVPGHALYFVGR